MKVSKAIEKTCPFMSVPLIADAEGYRNGRLHKVNCIAGNCMAWVYENTHKEFNELSLQEQSKIDFKNTGETELTEGEKEGYCTRLDPQP